MYKVYSSDGFYTTMGEEEVNTLYNAIEENKVCFVYDGEVLFIKHITRIVRIVRY